MTAKQQLTDNSLIDLLEKQRSNFTDQYCPLLIAQEAALQKANTLVKAPRESLRRNHSRQKAKAILNSIKKCISPEVFVLCALATTLSVLGTAKLGKYVSTIGRWWEGVYHPKSLTIISERNGMRISKTPALVRGVYQDILEHGQHTNQTYSGAGRPF
ncbi:hypothetical protein F5Y09DRAFT_134353 [Xylaria sp. FL1042]|nr:hypothetical protein F5Y09DRAFT_134353 [Xylaria sp. FL1042]